MNKIIELHETPELQKVADTMEALGNETRLAVFTLLVPAGRKGLLVGEIQSRLKVPASTLSHHLARLIQVGLVAQERQGRKLVCRANYLQMDEVLNFLTRNCCAADGSHTDQHTEHHHENDDSLEGSLS